MVMKNQMPMGADSCKLRFVAKKNNNAVAVNIDVSFSA